MLPNEEKDMILGFAEGHIKCKGEFDDFIEGKGSYWRGCAHYMNYG